MKIKVILPILLFAALALVLFLRKSEPPVDKLVETSRVAELDPIAELGAQNTRAQRSDIRDVIPDGEVPEGNQIPDRFAMRTLNAPMPASVDEILSKITPYKEPFLPKANPTDEDFPDDEVYTGYRGYYASPGEPLRRIQIERGGESIDVAIEEVSGEMRTFKQKGGQLKVANFNADAYSLVLTFPDGRLIYLKYGTQIAAQGLRDPTRAMVGWLLSSKGADARAVPLAVTDSSLPEYEDKNQPGKYLWPPERVIRRLMPADLPSH